MVHFEVSDIILAIIGGFFISLSSSFNLYMKGRVTGFSGIFFSITNLEMEQYHWKAALLCGLIGTSAVFYFIYGFDDVWNSSKIFDTPEQMVGDLNYIGFAIAGFFAGIGTKLANGCTSGHGVCGLPRFSLRSWMSVGLFLPMGIGLATLRHYEPFLNNNENTKDITQNTNYDIVAGIVLGLSLFILVILLIVYYLKKSISEVLVGLVTGILFSIGLGYGGMYRRSKILGFLSIYENWDPSLLFLLGTAVGLNMVTFNYMIFKKQKPILHKSLSLPTKKEVDLRLVAGSIIFGLSWGLGGLCPGPAMGLISIFSLHISIVWLIAFGVGQKFVGVYDSYQQKKYQFLKVTSLSTLPREAFERKSLELEKIASL
ncbi:hypothetical protein ABPG74_018255 [Tetrahymena malaccensis]